ncbi:MAG: Crp/Fnr family transcriptional regulator [Gammaproteobacteria bacterium]
MNQTEKKLLRFFSELPEEERRTLLAFAEFLHGRARTAREIPAPAPIPRPEQESVVGALKRLSATYHMLNKAKMLNETSVLMTQHVMQGRDAVEVIDELEVLFRRHYERLISENGDGEPQ